jgi:hypothetical protein
MVWVLSGHHASYFLSFHLKIDIFDFSLKFQSMINNGSVLSGQAGASKRMSNDEIL